MRLALVDVCASYGTHRVLDGVTFHVDGGEIVGLIGPNGSGKSTSLAIAAGLLEPTAGHAEIDGLTRHHDSANYSSRIGLVPQEPALYDELSVTDNLAFFGSLYGVSGRLLARRSKAVLGLVELSDRAHSRVSSLSGGMQRRANVACALVHEPAILLLDEPTAALDPRSRHCLYEALGQLRDAGRAILMTTHHLDEAEEWCDRIVVLRGGKVVADGRPADLMAQSRQPMIVGKLRDDLPEHMERAIRARLPVDVDWRLNGRDFSLVAIDGESLGYSLALLHTEGAEPESFRTPAVGLDRLYDEAPTHSPAIAGGA